MALVALGLAPGTWLRSPPPTTNSEQVLRVTPIAVPPRQWGPLRLVAAWQLASPNSQFGGFSGLVVLRDGKLLAASDRADMLVMSPPPQTPGAGPVTFSIERYGRFDPTRLGFFDLESLTRDPVSGRLWSAYEQNNFIMRIDEDYRHRWYRRPRAMRNWAADFGPEAMVRLADGRFIVLAERSPRWFAATSPGLVFPYDPIAGAKPFAFKVETPAGYSPTDIAQLPDGRVLVLLRKFRLGLPPTYPCKIAIADPRDLRPGVTWRPRVIADLAAPLPSDNYEGLAIAPDPDGGSTVWVISDDNKSGLQRTLLLKLRWEPETTTARGSSARRG